MSDLRSGFLRDLDTTAEASLAFADAFAVRPLPGDQLTALLLVLPFAGTWLFLSLSVRLLLALHDRFRRHAHYRGARRAHCMGAPIRRLCRTSVNPMPDIETIVEAYQAARGRGRVAEKIRCGSLLLDAEAGVDSSLIRTSDGEIAGRNPGLRGWIGERAPWLLKHYVSLMQYRRLAQAFREAHGLRDPHPAALLLSDDAAAVFPQPARGRIEKARREASELLASGAARTVKDFRAALARREWRRTG